ncbi:MAG TPA: hypothetical protein VHD62_17665 [Opitutaceae bacterium]|nr:hypothetical protein [Opitutaceae bacterium]
MKKLSRLVRALALASTVAFVASAAARPFMIVAYNVENLHDVDGIAQFEDYQPAKYSRAHALTKLQNIARVVSRFENGRGPDILICCEIEVDFTPSKSPPDYEAILARYAGEKIEDMLGAKFDAGVGDLPAEALLLKTFADRGMTGYHVVVADNALAPGGVRKVEQLEQKCVVFTRFPVKAARSHPTQDARAILEVLLEVDGAPLYVFANHWKSGASDPATEATRIANAQTLRTRLDEILRADPNADIVLGGDFNSQFNQNRRYAATMKRTGLNDVLGSQGNELAIRGTQRDLYNLWYELPPEQRGSDTYRGEWGTLMHLIVTRGLYDYRGVQYVDNSFGVAKFPGLNEDDKGLPIRWSFDGPAGGGFSDHFPVYAKFVTVPDGRADRYIALRNGSVEGADAVNKIDYAKVELEKVALVAAQLPAGASLRTDANKGRIVRVEGRIAPGARLAVEFRGDTYDVWSYDEALRKKLRADYAAGATIRFYGELGQYKDRWQFVIQDPSWVK